jgi:hypothetical protein
MLELLVGAFLGSSLTKKYSNMSQEEIKEDLTNKANTISKIAGAGAELIADKVFASKEDIDNNKHITNHDDLVEKMFGNDSDE